jgi:hypothetical protein
MLIAIQPSKTATFPDEHVIRYTPQRLRYVIAVHLMSIRLTTPHLPMTTGAESSRPREPIPAALIKDKHHVIDRHR